MLVLALCTRAMSSSAPSGSRQYTFARRPSAVQDQAARDHRSEGLIFLAGDQECQMLHVMWHSADVAC